jgi:hypothetical protein
MRRNSLRESAQEQERCKAPENLSHRRMLPTEADFGITLSNKPTQD